MKKTLVFISTLEHLPWGGCEDLWYKTALVALTRGHPVIVLTFRHDTVPTHLQRLQKEGAVIYFLERPNHAHSFLKRVVRKLQPGKIHRKVLSGLINVLGSSQYSVVVSQAGGFDFCYSYLDEIAEWLLNQKAPVTVIIQNVSDLGFTVSLPVAEKQRKIFRKAKTVCFVSERNRISSERILAMHIPNGCVVCNPLNVELGEPLPYPDRSEIISFAEVAALRCFHKGQDILFQVLSGQQWKGRNWQLNLYGEGPDKAYLEELAAFYHISEKIHFHGQVKDIREVWRDNHIHVLPSLGEGTPLALIESMYCGRPAITSDVGGNAEYCKDGISGFICDYPTPTALERVMEKAWIERGRWKEMGRKASEKINKDYNLEGSSTLYEFISA